MALIIDANPAEFCQASPGGSMSPGYLENMWATASHALSNLPDRIANAGYNFFNQAKEEFKNSLANSTVSSLSRVLNRVKDVSYETRVVPVNTPEDLNHASPLMQNYLAANPALDTYMRSGVMEFWEQEHLLEQAEYGFSEENPYYQRAVDGFLQTGQVWDGDKSVEADFTVRYSNDETDDDKALSLDEQTFIKEGWSLSTFMAKNGTDPTSLSDTKL